ncbi:MAG: alpha/beta hydrolase [Candidatus Heimdallarchaeaceae archaeon]
MENSLQSLAKPYLFKADTNLNNTLILLLHGFGASCTETRPLAEFLRSKGFDCYGILLSGHGTVSTDLDTVKWEDWISDIHEAYEQHRSSYDNIFIGGVSLGGALSLYAATFLNFNGVFTINAFYNLEFFQKIIIPILSLFKIHIPKSKARVKWYKDHSLFSYSDDPTYGAKQIRKFHKVLHSRIKEITIPTLLIQSQSDQTINPRNADQIYRNLRTDQKSLLRLPKGDHVLTVDKNRGPAFEAIVKFVTDLVQANEP